MEKRTIIAIVLSVGVLYAYSYLFPPAKPAVAPGTSAKQAQLSSTKGATPVLSASTAASAAPAAAPAVPVAGQPATATRDISVDTDLFTAVFSTQGAALKKLVLKKYKETAGPQGKDIVLVDESNPTRFGLLTDSRELGIASNAVYQVSGDNLKLSDGNKGSIEFTTVTPQGVELKKRFSFAGNAYQIGLTEELRNAGAGRADGKLHILQNDRVVPHKSEGRYEVYGPMTLAEGKVSSDKLDNLLKAPVQHANNVTWSSFGDKYFMGAIIADKGSIATVSLSRPGTDSMIRDITAPAVSLQPGQSAALNYSIYYGPKDLDILKAQGNRLEDSIDYGWFGPVAKPLVFSLKYLYTYTGNYGIAIIIITFILKLIFFPLTHKSYKSMKEMQKLQPKMTELKEKFKNDRDAMNKAVMELYKTHKVNPMGGCLPMLVQIPVFFGLYRALMYSIELRHAPFMLWITDLSAKDPYYVTPIIMGATMFIQQKMTPTNMDPVQAKMMLMLPIVFTFMFLNFPSGLVIYWLVNNVLTIVQQMYINKTVQD